METAPVKRLLTEKEYLLIERQANDKSEFYCGELFAMSGAGRTHNIISQNLSRHIGNFLSGKQCQGYGSDMRVHIPANSLYTYPDFLIVCGEENFLPDAMLDTLLNPCIVFEILSDRTKGYDKGKKFELYSQIKTLEQYILVDSTGLICVESHTKESTEIWKSAIFENLDQSVHLDKINLSLRLADIYEKTYKITG